MMVNNKESESNEINIFGRYLTSVLRHRALDLKLKMKPDGYVKVVDILSLKEKTKSNRVLKSYTLNDVELAVQQDNKNRMKLRGSGKDTEIRANQGHSNKLKSVINDELLLDRITKSSQIECCIHGTYYKYLPLILKDGYLSSMTRKHVHFSTKFFGSKDIISGMRKNCEVLIYLDVEKALNEGVNIFLSDNEVALIPKIVSSHLFEKICDASTGKKLY